jgi:hypothetical protein
VYTDQRITIMGVAPASAASAAYFTSASQGGGSTARLQQAVAAPSAASGDGASTIVTLSNGRTSSVTPYAGTLAATPLAAAWAPQTLVAGDHNQDQQLSESEFADQLERVGISADAARKLFASFDMSRDDSVDVDEFVKGVGKDVASGSTVFTQLIDSYVNNPSGSVDQQAMGDFLRKGAALARQYALMSGAGA